MAEAWLDTNGIRIWTHTIIRGEKICYGKHSFVLQVFEDGGAVVEVTLQVAQKRTDAFVPLGVLTGPFMPTVLDHSTLTQCQGIVTPGQDSSSDLFLAEVATHRYCMAPLVLVNREWV